jgi:tetratricopeptide (TPR) repeat protein
LKRNGAYRALPLLRAGYDATGDPAAGVAWLLDMATATENQTDLLTQLVNSGWIPAEQREPIFTRILELVSADAAKAQGNAAKEYQQSIVRDWQLRWIENLITTKQYPRAQQVLDGLTSQSSDEQKQQLVPVQVRLAALTNALDPLLDSYRSDTSRMPSTEILRTAATALMSAGDRASAQKILEIVFNREIEQHNLNAANLLGLAEIRLDRNDLAGAMTLLRRMTLVAGEPFQNHEAAAALLEQKGHSAEAAQFRAELAKAVPWDLAAKARLAESEISGGSYQIAGLKALSDVVSSPMAPYAVRVASAKAFARLRGTAEAAFKSGSGELDLLSSKQSPDAVAAEKPFYFEARLKAANTSADPEVRTRLLRGALEYFPYADAARPPLFRAAMQQSKYQVAVSAMEPLTETGAFAAATSAQPSGIEPDAANPSGGAGVPQSERAQILAGLARALEKLERYDQAVTNYQQAIRLEKTASTKADLRKSLDAVRTILNRRKLNLARQPIVRPELEQVNVVRPRLQVPAKVARTVPAKTKPPASAQGARRTQ